MGDGTPKGRGLAWALAGLMLAQAVLGLGWPGHYRDTGYARETWLGNDLVTLTLALPTLLAGLSLEGTRPVLGRLLRLGGIGYGVYNYAFYLLGAALNPIFPLYVGAAVVGGAALIASLVGTDPVRVAEALGAPGRDRWIGGFFVLVAVGLTGVWMSMWAAHVFAGADVPGGEPDAFRLVAALDLTLMVPALGWGGAMLWLRRPWGAVIAAVAGVQGTLYLAVLTLNAVRFLARGLVAPPGELPIWGGLALATGVATLAHLSRVHETRQRDRY